MKEDGMGRVCGMHHLAEDVCRVLVGKLEGQILLGRPTSVVS
jgi:hypothetical protein